MPRSSTVIRPLGSPPIEPSSCRPEIRAASRGSRTELSKIERTTAAVAPKNQADQRRAEQNERDGRAPGDDAFRRPGRVDDDEFGPRDQRTGNGLQCAHRRRVLGEEHGRGPLRLPRRRGRDRDVDECGAGVD